MTDFTRQKALDYNTELRTGKIPGSSLVRLTATTQTLSEVSDEVWNGSSSYVFNYANAGETHEIFSTDANDTLGGSGAEKITIDYITDDFVNVIEEFELNGATVAIPDANKLTVNRAFVSQIGTAGGGPAGDIIIRKAGGGDERALLMKGINISEDGILQVPAGFTWLLTGATPITVKGGDASFLLETTTGEDGIWIPQAGVSVYQNVHNLPINTINIVEKSLVRVLGSSTNDGTVGVVELIFTQVENS